MTLFSSAYSGPRRSVFRANSEVTLLSSNPTHPVLLCFPHRNFQITRAHTHTQPRTATPQFRQRTIMSTASCSGHIAYEAMSNAQKAELSAYLREQLAIDTDNSKWKAQMQLLVRETLARRAASGESVDAGSILAEVLPLVRAAIPESVREGLFRKVAKALNA